MKNGILMFLLVLVMAFSLVSASAETTTATFNDVTYKVVELSKDDPNYYSDLAKAERWNFKQIRNFPTL